MKYRRMEIVMYRRQRVDYGEQSDTTCLVPKFACCVAGPSEFFIQRFPIERSRTASPGAVLQRASLKQHSLKETLFFSNRSKRTSSKMRVNRLLVKMSMYFTMF